MQNHFMIDVTGTVLDDQWKPIESSISAIDKINSDPDKEYCLLSNVTTHARKFIFDTLEQYGFKVPIDKIITPAIIAEDFILKNCLNVKFFVSEELRRDDFSSVSSNETANYDAVLMGDIDYTHVDIEEIVNIILEGSKLYTLANNRIYKKDGRYKIDVGAWAVFVKVVVVKAKLHSLKRRYR